jgi:hypothetical protein
LEKAVNWKSWLNGKGLRGIKGMTASSHSPRAANGDSFWRRPARYLYRRWRSRHRHPFNFAIHLVGIPLAVAGVVLFLALPWSQWYWGASAFVLGYVLQYWGHRVEGNDVGEWAAIKRLLGWPYVSVSPRWQTGETGPASSPSETSAT